MRCTTNFIFLRQIIPIPCKPSVKKLPMITFPSYFFIFIFDCQYIIIICYALLTCNILLVLTILNVTHDRTRVRCRPCQTVIQQLNHVENKFVDLRVCSVNKGTLRGDFIDARTEISRHLLVRRLNLGEKAGRMICGKMEEYKLFCI